MPDWRKWEEPQWRTLTICCFVPLLILGAVLTG